MRVALRAVATSARSQLVGLSAAGEMADAVDCLEASTTNAHPAQPTASLLSLVASFVFVCVDVLARAHQPHSTASHALFLSFFSR